MAIDGETFDPYSAETIKVLPAAHESYKEEIIQKSREKYSLSLKEVKKRIEEEERIKTETEEVEKLTSKKEDIEEDDIEPLV